MARIELPPPAHILLAYAADGWAAENGQFNPSGKPKPPPSAAWLPAARTLLKEPDGLNRLRDLTLAGMTAWNVDPTIIACVVPAFASPDFAARLAWRLGMAGWKGPEAAPPPAVQPGASVIAPATVPLPPSAAPARPPPKPKP